MILFSKRTLVIGISMLVLLASCEQKQAVQNLINTPVDVSTLKVSLQTATYFDKYPGTVVALNQVDLRTQVNGFITGVYFEDGSYVRKGQKLYTIDAQQYAANYNAAVATLQVQESNLLKAQKDADRYHELQKNDAIATQQVDYADAARDAAIKQVEAAKANVQSLQTNVRYTTITAPFDGTIGLSQVKIGTAVSAGQTILNTVSTDDPMAVDFSIDQKEIYRFLKLLQQPETKADSTFSVAFEGNNVYPFLGKISMLDRAVDPQTGTLKVRLSFPNKQGLLRSGMNCTVRVQNKNETPVIVIPAKAATEQLGEFFVYVVTDGKVTQRKVLLGTTIGANVIVTEGLKEQEEIVVDGVQKLHEGSVINKNTQAKQ